MAQLLKLQDYISRYEQDLNKYLNQFIRVKQRRWDEYKEKLAHNDLHGEQLKKVRQAFLDELYLHQLQWASSTIAEKSQLAARYEHDNVLKLLLQTLPDTYLVFYDPVFKIENASVEMEAIIVTPTIVYCLAILKGKEDDIYLANKERFWKVIRGEQELKVVSPFLSLKRSENVTRKLTENANALPIKKIILAPGCYVDHFQEFLTVECYDKRSIKEWQKKAAGDPSPIKFKQLKIARTLLGNSMTESYFRDEEDRYFDRLNRQFPGE
ncbi:hypothetical protein DCC39_13005 [Pueribacillus theae]|uniref:NERD domain-containing protein n=1 Tax=Pueribacillus theae TaxID=2171751 RepID=A0A2U1JW99_9BACI|nr:hypothetical protein [Pueribacillus theae]PWA09490.1 hypothetical protein DCC39_13005 [Pueribacillus theae]